MSQWNAEVADLVGNKFVPQAIFNSRSSRAGGSSPSAYGAPSVGGRILELDVALFVDSHPTTTIPGRKEVALVIEFNC